MGTCRSAWGLYGIGRHRLGLGVSLGQVETHDGTSLSSIRIRLIFGIYGKHKVAETY